MKKSGEIRKFFKKSLLYQPIWGTEQFILDNWMDFAFFLQNQVDN